MKKRISIGLSHFIMAFLAGVAISIGGVAFLASPNKVVGSLFFAVGLFMVCTLGLNLFTGKVTTALDEKPRYILRLINIYFGNLAGAVGVGYMLRATRLADSLMDYATAVANGKIGDGFLSIFLLGIMCNVLIFLAVYGFKHFDSPLMRFMALLSGVSVFVLVGFEHCVANMFYFSFSNTWSGGALLCLLFTTLGNIVGGLLFPLLFKLKNRLDKDSNL